MASKQERKLRSKQALQKRLEEFQYFHIFSDLDLSVGKWIKLLKRETKNFNVNLDFQIKDNRTIRVFVPNIDIDSSCFITIGGKPEFTVTVLEDYEGAESSGVFDILAQMNVVVLSAQRKMNDVINLVFNTCVRLLGRITKGILADEEQRYISIDWVAWSNDYYENDLFRAFNYEHLPGKYPALKRKKFWGLF